MSPIESQSNAAASGEFVLAGELPVRRLGFGAMRITGLGIWGNPHNIEGAKAVLRRAVELGVNFIDTADSYGPEVSENLIAEALYPYKGIVIATKGGLTRQGPDRWAPVGRPEYLRQCAELSLRRLKVDTIDLYQLHRIDPKVPASDQFGLLKELQQEGKIRYIGLSEVTADEIREAEQTIKIVSVQNLYNLGNRQSEAVLDYSERHDIGFIPWFPVGGGDLLKAGGPFERAAANKGVTVAQLSLAWLLKRSQVMLPIPGTSSIAHLEENVAAGSVDLSDEEFIELSILAKT